MKRKLALLLSGIGCFMVPSCLTIDQNGLLDLGSELVCEVATSGLPFSRHLHYCSVVDIDLTPGS